MNQAASFVTLATPDLDAARAFYVAGLGWEPLFDVPGEILFFQIAPGVTLGLFDAAKFAADLGSTEVPQLAGLTLSQNVSSAAEVDDLVAATVRAGGRLVKSPQTADFGGYHGHVADPNGVIWEIAYNSGWSVEPDGTVQLGPVED